MRLLSFITLFGSLLGIYGLYKGEISPTKFDSYSLFIIIASGCIAELLKGFLNDQQNGEEKE
jgi:hypothetical protein